jgi:putative endonuclease
MSYFTYIIKSQRNGKYYVGSSDDVQRRLQDHNWSRTPSTKTGIPWKLVYFEKYDTRSEAMTREYEIKAKKSKSYIDFLIQNFEQNF